MEDNGHIICVYFLEAREGRNIRNSNNFFASHNYSSSRTHSALVVRTSQSLNAKELLGRQSSMWKWKARINLQTFFNVETLSTQQERSISPTTDTGSCLFQKGESLKQKIRSEIHEALFWHERHNRVNTSAPMPKA